MTDTIFTHPLVAAVIVALLLLGVIGKLMKYSFERIAKWYLYVSVFAIVVVMDSIFFPFIGGKDFFFRFAVELAAASMVLWWAFEARGGEARKRVVALFKRPMVIAVSLFVAAVELATIFSYDAQAAFWSNFERGEGGFQMLHYYAFFLLLVLILVNEVDWRNIFKFSLVSSGLMILYGIAGNYGIPTFIGPYAAATPPAGFWHKLFDGRFQGSLGNPAYVDPYLIFSMFFAAYLWVGDKITGTLTTLKSWGYGAMIAIFFVFFILGQTRGAFIGLAAGVLALALYLIFSSKGATRKWGAIGFGILLIVGLGLYSVRNTDFVKNLPEGRLLQLSLSDSTAQTRFWVWDEAWKGFLERPIFGWGPENFSPVFDKFFNPNFYQPGANSETWFDRAHSVFFDYLAETGILGLLAYLGIFATFLWQFIKKVAKASDQNSSAHHGTLVALRNGLIFILPIAYLVQGIAIFDVLPMYISLFLFLAFSTYYFSAHKKS